MQYFKVYPSLDTSQVGTHPQVEDLYQYKGDVSYDTYQWLDFNSKPEDFPDLHRFELKKKAKQTDVLSNSLISEKVGLFVDAEKLDALTALKLTEMLSLDATVYKGKSPLAYKLLFFKAIRSTIDFSASVFELTGLLSFFPGDEIRFPDASAYDEKARELLDAGGLKVINPVDLKLTEQPDLFRPPGQPYLVGSENLKKIVEDTGISGLEFSALEFKISV